MPDIAGYLHKGPANHWVPNESVGGHLYLMPNCLYFDSHSLNFQVHALEMPYSQIEQVSFYSNLLIPNGLAVHLRGGYVERFVVTKRKQWAAMIMEKVAGT